MTMDGVAKNYGNTSKKNSTHRNADQGMYCHYGRGIHHDTA